SPPVFMTYRMSFFGSYSIQVRPSPAFRSFGSAIGFDQVVPPSVLSTMPALVSLNRCLASLPLTRPWSASLHSLRARTYLAWELSLAWSLRGLNFVAPQPEQ